MDFFFLAVIFFVASAAIGRFFYLVVGSLFLFVSWQEDLFFFQLAACVVFGCCVLGATEMPFEPSPTALSTSSSSLSV